MAGSLRSLNPYHLLNVSKGTPRLASRSPGSNLRDPPAFSTCPPLPTPSLI